MDDLTKKIVELQVFGMSFRKTAIKGQNIVNGIMVDKIPYIDTENLTAELRLLVLASIEKEIDFLTKIFKDENKTESPS